MLGRAGEGKWAREREGMRTEKMGGPKGIELSYFFFGNWNLNLNFCKSTVKGTVDFNISSILYVDLE